jgi:SAM-dependent methyltransferase
MSRPIPLTVWVCLLYNRLFRFRARSDWLIRDLMEAEQRRHDSPEEEALRYADMEYAKAGAFLGKFGDFPLAGKRVLDFGCRYGGSSVWYAQQGAADVIGVDVSADLLDVARKYTERKLRNESADAGEARPGPRIEFRLGGSRSIPVEDASVDLIFSEDVVEHLEDPEATFREWWRVLAAGGNVALSFGPLWYHPHGVHLWEIFPAPWNHVLFSERTCVRARNILKDDGNTGERWQDMNKMTLRRFKRLVRSSPFKPRLLCVHALWNLKPLLLLPGLNEFFASQVDAILEK